MPDLNLNQRQVIESPLDSKLFVAGPAGTGKTTAAVERMRHLLMHGVAGESILMLTPQRSLQEPYLDLLYSPERRAGGEVTPATIGGLARRMCDLFWPLAADAAGFAHPDQRPVFLTLETAQYYMAHLVRPLLDEGYFESVTIDRNRLYSQIIDNLNKAAVIGFPYTEIGARLDSAYFGDPAQRRVYADAQDCANRFRAYCLQNNLLDFSLQFEIFANILWPNDLVRNYLTRTYRHLIYDNVEEDGPRAHDIIREWLPSFDSALLIYDEGAGFRYFLGADVQTGWVLRELCNEHIVLNESFVMSEGITSLSDGLTAAIVPNPDSKVEGQRSSDAFEIVSKHFFPELLDAVVDEIHSLISNSLISNSLISPSEIVILAPYLSDALRFSITNRLDARNIPWRSHRPSRSLRDEPASRALITLAALAHPQWGIHPPKFDAAYALMQSIEGLDLVRAQLLTEIVYRQRDLGLSTFDQIKPDMQERITFSIGNRYSVLRDWLLNYRENDPLPLDHFFRRLFGEVLSQPGFGYHSDFDSVRVAASLVESVKKFRQSLENTIKESVADYQLPNLGREYIQMLQDGVIAASYLEGWQTEEKDAVLVAPAHTFLMMNRPVTVQFWLDAGSSGWYERLSQPLTHPYVLSRGWDASQGRQWTDADEVQASKEALARLVSGLLHRCRERVYVCLSELGESGFEQRGELLRAFQKVLTSNEENN
jgi:superfamily I DNA/RNA helicase